MDRDYHFCLILIKRAFGPCACAQSASIIKPCFTCDKVNKFASKYRFQSVVDCVAREIACVDISCFSAPKENSKFLPRNKFVKRFRDICLCGNSNLSFCIKASLPLLIRCKTRENIHRGSFESSFSFQPEKSEEKRETSSNKIVLSFRRSSYKFFFITVPFFFQIVWTSASS